jgi:chromate transport protein ChrA
LSEPSRAPRLADLAIAFTILSLSGFGGVATQARYHLVARLGWLTDREFADAFGIGQVLPGANIANLAVIVGDRFAGPLGGVVCLAALCLPSLAVAVTLMLGAIRLTEIFPRFASVEAAITAATVGMILANGIRISVVVWTRTGARHPAMARVTRLGISLVTAYLIEGFGVLLPVAIIVMFGLSILFEHREAV